MPQPLDYESPKQPEPPENHYLWGLLLFVLFIFAPASRYAKPISMDRQYIIIVFASVAIAVTSLMLAVTGYFRKRNQTPFLAMLWTCGCALLVLWRCYQDLIELFHELGYI